MKNIPSIPPICDEIGCEYFQWNDLNPDNESRIKHLVSVVNLESIEPFESYKIQYATTPNDVHGVVVHVIKNKNKSKNEGYIPRHKRPEWDVVRNTLQPFVYDDGSCIVNQKCTINKNEPGTVTNGDVWDVVRRLNSNTVEIKLHNNNTYTVSSIMSK